MAIINFMELIFPRPLSINPSLGKLCLRKKVLEKIPLNLNSNIGSIKTSPSFDDMEDLKEALSAMSLNEFQEAKLEKSPSKTLRKLSTLKSSNKNTKLGLPEIKTCRAFVRRRKEVIIRKHLN